MVEPNFHTNILVSCTKRSQGLGILRLNPPGNFNLYLPKKHTNEMYVFIQLFIAK